MEIYKTTIRPVVTYSLGTWSLIAKAENNLCIFERQILRKIFGPVNIDYIWRIRSNMEINKSIEGADIVRFIKAKRINPYPTAFPYGNGMVLHFYQQQESSTTKTVHKVINKGLKTYV